MGKGTHYRDTEAFHAKAARIWDGYYDAPYIGAVRHHTAQLWARRQILRFLDKNVRPGDRILDAGCGRGDFTVELAGRFTAGDMTGFDCVPAMLAIGRRLAKERERVDFKEGDLRYMPFPDRGFDIVICNNALHHVRPEEQDGVLYELARVTGRLLILEIKNRKNIYSMAGRKRKIDVGLYPTTIKTVSSRLGECGFDMTGVSKRFIFEWLSPWSVLKFLRKGSG